MGRPIISQGEIPAVPIGGEPPNTVTVDWQLLGPNDRDDGTLELKFDLEVADLPQGTDTLRFDMQALRTVLNRCGELDEQIDEARRTLADPPQEVATLHDVKDNLRREMGGESYHFKEVAPGDPQMPGWTYIGVFSESMLPVASAINLIALVEGEYKRTVFEESEILWVPGLP